MVPPTSAQISAIRSNNMSTQTSSKRRISLPRLSFEGFRRISYSGQTSISADSERSPKDNSSLQGSYLTPFSSPDPETRAYIIEQQTPKRRQSSFSNILAATNKKIRELVNSFSRQEADLSDIEEAVVFSEKYTLDLPEHISRDKSELDYLRRTNAEAAAAALAIKNATKAIATTVKEEISAIAATTQDSGAKNVSLIEDIETISTTQQAKISHNEPENSKTTENNDTSPVEDDTESWEAKLARNPFYPFRDFRLEVGKKINATSESEATLREAAKARRGAKAFKRYALALTVEEVDDMMDSPFIWRIINIRVRADMEEWNLSRSRRGYLPPF